MITAIHNYIVQGLKAGQFNTRDCGEAKSGQTRLLPEWYCTDLYALSKCANRDNVTKKEGHQCSDLHLFQQEVADVIPLKPGDTTQPRPPVARRRAREADARMVEPRPPDAPQADTASHINSEDGSSHRKNGVQLRLLQKLKRGQFKPRDQLDLHSMTTAQGQRALLEFIQDSAGSSPRCIRVIHGKGLRSDQGPRLRNMTRQLLREHPGVLAFSACKPAHGGDGATDVLLRSS